MDPSLHVDIRGALVRGDNLRADPRHPLTLGIVPDILQAATLLDSWEYEQSAGILVTTVL